MTANHVGKKSIDPSLGIILGIMIARYGENFYNFKGLRQYKDKFDPVWTPKYLAYPVGLVLPRIFVNLATLVSGGLSGVLHK